MLRFVQIRTTKVQELHPMGFSTKFQISNCNTNFSLIPSAKLKSCSLLETIANLMTKSRCSPTRFNK
ncbi:hypothetical protein CICLE_v10006391mg [Citrus x clementina]|uniref:Uncharacterized protein n=1 Tax=Citrus clementina TaxID=85681 RepID=V4S965_CITCL|nr:hypothetical protein CICLE_v10006391mg [Citrus x clementina]